MRTSSAKAKGRRACQELQKLVLDTYPDLTTRDVRVTPSGSTGEDLQLSEVAVQLFPYAVEVKNQERLNIWQSLLQSLSHAAKLKLEPLLAFRRNRSEMWVAVRAQHFFELLEASEHRPGCARSKRPAHRTAGLSRSYGYGDEE